MSRNTPQLALSPPPPEIAREAELAKLLRRAARTRIPEDRVTVYAKLLIAAQEIILKEAFALKRREEMAAWASTGGLEQPTTDLELAGRLVRQNRMAQRQLANSAKATCRALLKFLSVLRRNVPALSPTAPGTNTVDGYNAHMATLTACADLLNLYVDVFSTDGTDILGRHKKFERGFKVGDARVGIAKTRTLPDQTLFWWYLLGPKNRGRWKEIHALARAWHLTSVHDPSSFRVYVRERRKKLGCSYRPPSWACPG